MSLTKPYLALTKQQFTSKAEKQSFKHTLWFLMLIAWLILQIHGTAFNIEQINTELVILMSSRPVERHLFSCKAPKENWYLGNGLWQRSIKDNEQLD